MEKRDKDLFDDEDLDNCVTSLWTNPDVFLMHEEMRSQITLLTQAYLFSGARIGAFVHGFPGEVKTTDGNMVNVTFKGLILAVARIENDQEIIAFYGYVIN